MVLNCRMPLLSVLSIQNVFFLLYLELFAALLCDAAHCVPYSPLGLRFRAAAQRSVFSISHETQQSKQQSLAPHSVL